MTESKQFKPSAPQICCFHFLLTLGLPFTWWAHPGPPGVLAHARPALARSTRQAQWGRMGGPASRVRGAAPGGSVFAGFCGPHLPARPPGAPVASGHVGACCIAGARSLQIYTLLKLGEDGDPHALSTVGVFFLGPKCVEPDWSPASAAELRVWSRCGPPPRPELKDPGGPHLSSSPSLASAQGFRGSVGPLEALLAGEMMTGGGQPALAWGLTAEVPWAAT